MFDNRKYVIGNLSGYCFCFVSLSRKSKELRSILAMTTVFMVIDRQINGKSTFYIQKEEYLNSFIARPANC
ncbi:hypothetical protein DW784_01820 [Parabacteroides merdae]|uniref:Uncharacterized protein n=1 Tax=Parabacteroides merdae TaxID=46503 RepID=A0A3R6FI81_9BACT|nr:hypothetical protein DWY66_13110 [Parabacteroides merdae]RGZ48426.1 hypothetical protein DW986_09460 [Parabacteroides merdae]RHD69426.1 hypothetical protein DW784_01820 [Parabacteroides merdae]RYS85902.1 hypothetical protein EAJ15_01430 [Parabacteroides merdae]HAY60476.1 hypothetical protein [Parabacteroides merdae]